MSWASTYPWSAEALREPLDSFYRGSHSTVGDGGAPTVSPVGSASLYYELDDNTLKLSVSGGAWASLGASTPSGWTDDGTVVRLTTITDQVGIGIAAPAANRKLHVVGNVQIDIADDVANAVQILETGSGSRYFEIDTSNANEFVFLGGGVSSVWVEVRGDGATAFRVTANAGQTYATLNTASTPEAWQFCDGVNNAIIRQQGSGGFVTHGPLLASSTANVIDPIAARGLQIKTHSGFEASKSVHTEHTVAQLTADATQTVMTGSTITLDANTARIYEIAVQARSSADQAAYRRLALVQRGAGAATIVGSVADMVLPIESAGATTWDATVTVSGNDVRISVTGAAATNILWTAVIRSMATVNATA